MAFVYVFVCKPKKSGVWEQLFEVTPGEHGIKMNVKLDVGVIPMSDDRNKVLGAVEEIKLIHWPEGVDGGIEVYSAYCDEDKWYAQCKTKFKCSPPENLLEQPIAYKHVIRGNNGEQLTSPMFIRLNIDWLPIESGKEYSDFDAKSNPNPDLKLKSSDGVRLYLKGDWIDGYSTLLKRYREGNYDQKMSKSDDGCFECPEFDAETLWVLFSYGQHKKVPYINAFMDTVPFSNQFVDVMRAADYFGANRSCDELFAMETRRLIHEGGTKDNFWGTNPMSVREYLDLWHHAINYNLPEMKLMLARHVHWFIEKMREDQAIWDEYCRLTAGISN